MKVNFFITVFSQFLIYNILTLFNKFGKIYAKEDTLVLVHVLFRHGNRTPNGPEELYPKDPYLKEKYFPFGLGQLTLAGKRREFSIGEALRERYDGFLGPYYYPELVEAQSTDYNRTKMSLQLVLAGLFPPKDKETWNANLNWQPIPYNYLQRSKDKILSGVSSSEYMNLYEKYVNSEKHQAELKKEKEIFHYVSQHTGLKVKRYSDIYKLYFGLATEEEWGFSLPSWTHKVWPQKIMDLAIKEYFVASATLNLKRLASGYLIKKILDDTSDNMSGKNKDRKLYLYSAHESNIAELLIAMEVFNRPHIPTYGSYVTFEVHKMKSSYGIKIFYENYSAKEPQLLKLPKCSIICEIKKFRFLLGAYLPDRRPVMTLF